MSKLFLVLSIIICFVKINECRVARDVAAADSSSSTVFTDLAKQAEDTVSIFHTKFLEFFEVKNDQELASKFQTDANDYGQKITGLIGQFTEQAKSQTSKLDEGFSAITAKINENVEALKNKDPKLFGTLEEYKNTIDETFSNVLKNTNELGTKLKEKGLENSKDLEGVVKRLYEETITATNKVRTDIEATLKEKKA